MPKVYKVHYLRYGHPQRSWPRVYDNLKAATGAATYMKNMAGRYNLPETEVFIESAKCSDWMREA